MIAPTKILEGSFSDFQFCAEKIYAYAQNIGHIVDEVKVTPIDKERCLISLWCVDKKQNIIYGEEVSPPNDLRAILLAGYLRAEMMMGNLYAKH